MFIKPCQQNSTAQLSLISTKSWTTRVKEKLHKILPYQIFSNEWWA